jgi:hypothetical protein
MSLMIMRAMQMPAAMGAKQQEMQMQMGMQLRVQTGMQMQLKRCCQQQLTAAVVGPPHRQPAPPLLPLLLLLLLLLLVRLVRRCLYRKMIYLVAMIMTCLA